jgi:hypothetical protein
MATKLLGMLLNTLRAFLNANRMKHWTARFVLLKHDKGWAMLGI